MDLSKLILFALLSAFIVITQTYYVGDLTIYSDAAVPARLELHNALLQNAPTRGDWNAYGAGGVNTRLLTVYGVDFFSRATGLGPNVLYRSLDMVSMFLTFAILMPYLSTWHPPEYGLIAVLFLAAILPMTYAFHYFHPWDRLGLLLWIAFAWGVRRDRVGLCVILLVLAMLNKYDSIVLPLIYGLAHISRTRWRIVALRTGGLFVVAVATYMALLAWAGGDPSPRTLSGAMELALSNIGVMAQLNFHYPPFVGFTLPLIMVGAGWSSSDQAARAGALVAGFVLFGPLLLLTNFHELRAEMGALILMLPVALMGLRRVLAGEHRPSQPEDGPPAAA